MVDRPEHQVASFAEAGADSINVHVEATPHVRYALDAVRDAGLPGRPGAEPRDGRRGSAAGGRPGRHRAVHDREPGLGRPGLHPRLRAQGGAPARAAGRGHADHGGRRHRRRHRRALRARRARRCSWPARRCSAETIPAAPTARWPRRPARSEREVRRGALGARAAGGRLRGRRHQAEGALLRRRATGPRGTDLSARGREQARDRPRRGPGPGPVLRSPVAHGDERALPLAFRGRRRRRSPPPRPPARAPEGPEPSGEVPRSWAPTRPCRASCRWHSRLRLPWPAT